MTPFLRFFVRRVLQIIPVVLAIAALNFLLVNLAPGDAASIIVANSGGGSAQEVDALRASLGLNEPLGIRFLLYMKGLLTLNLGYSHVQSMPVIDLVLQRIPATLLLMFTALVFAIVIGVLLGIITAVAHRSVLDHVVNVMTLLVFATPHFWLALMLIVLFSAHLGILPSGGMTTIMGQFSTFGRILDVGRHLVLPALTLAMFYIATYTRLMRSAMLEVLNLDYITAARARGVSERGIAFGHAARNAMLPVVTMAGVQIGHALGGSILIETVFGWPGLGRLVFDSLMQRDLPTLLGVLLISSILVIVVSTLVDVINSLLDPRIAHR